MYCYVNLRILKRIDIESQERHSHLEGFLLEALEASEEGDGNAGKSTGFDDNVDDSDEDD